MDFQDVYKSSCLILFPFLPLLFWPFSSNCSQCALVWCLFHAPPFTNYLSYFILLVWGCLVMHAHMWQLHFLYFDSLRSWVMSLVLKISHFLQWLFHNKGTLITLQWGLLFTVKNLSEVMCVHPPKVPFRCVINSFKDIQHCSLTISRSHSSFVLNINLRGVSFPSKHTFK